MKRLITAAAISVTLFVAGCSSDATPSAQADTPSTDTPSTDTPSTQTPFDGLLLGSAGGFDTVGEWTSDNGSVNIVDDNGNNVNSTIIPDGTATPDAPWNRNFQHVVAITQGETYTIKFKARSDRNRSIFVGIGLNQEPWTNAKESVALTAEWQDFEVTLAATDFGGDLNRIFFELAGEDGLVLIDDVSIAETSETPQVGTGSVVLPVTFEDDELAYTWEGFGGGVATIIDNPQPTGNSSTKVTQLVKGEGEPFAGNFLTLDTPIDFTQGDLFTINFWSASLRPVLLKLEGSLGNAEITATHSGSGTWESLEFDFTSLTSTLGDVVQMTVIVENGALGDGSANWTFYADDFAQSIGEVTVEPTEPVVSTSAFDFETATTTSTWTVFENDDNPALEIIANPVSGEGNTSATVAKFTARQAGAPYAGAETAHGAIGPFILSADESTVKIMVYKTVISDVGIKLVTTSGGALGELKVPNTLVNQWEELTFDFSSYIGQAVYATEQVDQLVVFPDFNLDGRAADTVSYFDNISFDVPVGGETPVVDSDAAPMDSAATPPARAAGDVVSVFGETYTATAGLNYNPDWGQSGLNDLNDSYNPGDGDLSLAYVNFNYQGTELAAIDASAMEYLHVDIWVPEGTDRLVKVTPINNGTGASEVLVTVPVTPGSWNSVDLPKSAFVGMTWDSVFQMKFDGQFNGDGSANTESFDVYLDNIYFYKSEGDTTPPDGGDTTPPDDSDTNLVGEGDFSAAGDWSSDNGGINIIDDGGNSINSVTIPDGTATPDAPWNRNFQQVIPITQGESYTVMFRARSDRSRSILVGIGLNEAPWTNVKESVALTTEWQDFEVALTATDFGGDLNRIFFELAGEDGLVLIDDISIVQAVAMVTPPPIATGSVVLPVTFDDAELAYTWGGFDGGVATIIDNPQPTGNSSPKVTQLVKGEGAPFAGNFLTLDTPIDFTQGELFTMNFWSASLRPVLLKLEGSFGNAELTATHSGSGTWEPLEFDFTSLGSTLGDVVTMTVIVENGALGDGSANWTFYADDFAQSSDGATVEPVVSTSVFDFETATTTSTWTVFENDDNPALEVIANPVSGDGNTSATVAKFTAKQAGAPYAGLETAHGAIGPFILSADESTVKIMVYKTVISDVGIKLVTTSGGALGEFKVPNTLVNQWEELTFDFSSYIGQAVYATEQVDQLVVFPDFNLDGRATDTVNYFDNISFGVPVEGETPVVGSDAAPTESAATPPARAVDDVISVFGETYTATAGLNYNPDWGQSGLNDLNDSYNPGDGDLSLAYVNFNYQGTELAAIDASAMEYLHVDIWVPEGTDRLVKVTPINNGTGPSEVLVTVPVTPGSWNSVDLPKSAFVGMTWDSVFQMKFDGQFNGDGSANGEPYDVYLDNIYFY